MLKRLPCLELIQSLPDEFFDRGAGNPRLARSELQGLQFPPFNHEVHPFFCAIEDLGNPMNLKEFLHIFLPFWAENEPGNCSNPVSTRFS